MTEKQKQLEETMAVYAAGDVCLAFSGGVDSSLLLKTACDAAAETGKLVYAVTFATRLHPPCDLDNARTVAGELGGIHCVLTVDELEQEEIRNNPVDRCYLCKRHLFQTLKAFAAEKGIGTVIEGTNEDDLHTYRPGIRALRELGIVSPLALLHITKAEVKEMAAAYGISSASRPSTPCMATRLPYNTRIDYETLERIGKGEEYVRSLTGGNLRLRLHGEVVRLEAEPRYFARILESREQIIGRMKELGFPYVTLDLEGFRSGSMDYNVLSERRTPARFSASSSERKTVCPNCPEEIT